MKISFSSLKERLNRFLPNLSLLLAAFLVVGLGLEGALRLQQARAQRLLWSKYADKELCYQSDPVLIFKYRANKHGFNSRGYFDNEHTAQKPDGVFRIVVIGDSIAAGNELGLDQPFGKCLEKKLNASLAPRRFEIIILARGGYSTAQELVVFKEEALEYQPDLVLWSYCLNDPAHPVFHDASGGVGQFYFRPKIYAVHFLQKRLFLLAENIKARRCPRGDFDETIQCVYWANTEKQIQQIGRLSQEAGVPVFFLIHPDLFHQAGFENYPLGYIHAKLTRAALQYGLLPVDLFDCYKAHPVSALALKKNDPWHLNAAGHQLVADWLYEFLQQRWDQL